MSCENKSENQADNKPVEPDDDYWMHDEDEASEEPDYYLCYCCGYSTIVNHGGWGCPRCTAIMSPEYY